ncbi:MAG: hypothetical protein ABI876_08105 [Bacteroidota bacterium]
MLIVTSVNGEEMQRLPLGISSEAVTISTGKLSTGIYFITIRIGERMGTIPLAVP